MEPLKVIAPTNTEITIEISSTVPLLISPEPLEKGKEATAKEDKKE